VLTVVTLNLWHDQQEWPKRLERIVSELRRFRPDVICLQEVLQHSALRNQAETLAERLDCHVRFASVDRPERLRRYGNAILTPHRVVAAGHHDLAPGKDHRVVAHARFEWQGRTIDAYSTHLHETPEGWAIRATQIHDLLDWVDATRGGGPAVMAGDFNAELAAPEMGLLVERYVDSFRGANPDASREEGATYNRRYGGDRGAIDHIFVERRAKSRLKPRKSEVIFRTVGSDGVWASDHFGLIATLEVASIGR
jgi:endonuclease/exonuclease/phosphatase family metal-dependent hydrolase